MDASNEAWRIRSSWSLRVHAPQRVQGVRRPPGAPQDWQKPAYQAQNGFGFGGCFVLPLRRLQSINLHFPLQKIAFRCLNVNTFPHDAHGRSRCSTNPLRLRTPHARSQNFWCSAAGVNVAPHCPHTRSAADLSAENPFPTCSRQCSGNLPRPPARSATGFPHGQRVRRRTRSASAMLCPSVTPGSG